MCFVRDQMLTANHEANCAVRLRYVARLTGFCIFGCDVVAWLNPKAVLLRICVLGYRLIG